MSTMGGAGGGVAAGLRPSPRRAACVVSLAAGAWFTLISATATADVSGRAVVVDGDTIEVAGERVRLHGIDAPESRQVCSVGGSDWRCGESAALALADQADGRTVVCKGDQRDRYGRIIAVCFAGATDLNAMMVREGFALAYRQYSKDYVGEEESARISSKGVWRSSFIEPWKWRRTGNARVRSASR
ncbi:MAG TPA: thermonuclease family protein [Rhodospirillales bacterium]|nr:thermonuclease family protein [Rhodospirillales bacterium]